MNKKHGLRALAVLAGGAMCVTAIPLSACGNKGRDSIIIMAEEFSGLFNPFYATAGSDMDVVGMTQLSMLTTNSKGELVAGEDEATVVLDYQIDTTGNDSVYTFVLKNGLKFSDGKPLTMNDVMFNIYEYLDPVYTGSSTMYSIKIKGLSKYRTQQNLSDDSDDSGDAQEAYSWARVRRNELLDTYRDAGQQGSSSSTTYYLEPEQMEAAIKNRNVSETYKEYVSNKAESEEWYRNKLLEDYRLVCKTFKEELNSDFSAARESYDLTTMPYLEHASKFENGKNGEDDISGDIFKFFLYEGYITPKYENVQGKDNKLKIESFNNESTYSGYKTQADAVEKVYNDKIAEDFINVITGWGTAGEILTKFSADATQLILEKRSEDGKLNYPHIDGIVSLGHRIPQSDGTKVYADTETEGGKRVVKVKNENTGKETTYKIAEEHNGDGTPKNPGEYDVLRITVNGKDPKAKYNFSFTVAPAHYYTADAEHPNGRNIDIENDAFGVVYGNSTFQGEVIQSQRNVKVPLGAGPYKASNNRNEDDPSGMDFWNNNFVYFKANSNFMFPVKTEKLRYQYVSSTNALDKLANKEIDFVTPQFTKPNSDRLTDMQSKGFEKLFAWQLGYGYVGINAGKVPNLNVRKAIMSAMQASLATQYYETGTCEVIDWPMSNQSWAYPKENDSSKPNNHDYTMWEGDDKANAKIVKYTNAAMDEGVTKADLKIKFTIAGAAIAEHPTYAVFKKASDLLNNSFGGELWNIEVKADSQALTKLATGSLEVWAAAWGSTIDPDMYQVYHMNSSATSVYAWGYRQILAERTTYDREYATIVELSGIIDDARSILEEEERKPLYEQAMGLVLDLAVEMPIYQRQNLYAYDSNRLKGINKEVNPFTSPLEKIWNIELVV